MLLCYAPVLYRLVHQWVTDEDMGHGFFCPAGGCLHHLAETRRARGHQALSLTIGAC